MQHKKILSVCLEFKESLNYMYKPSNSKFHRIKGNKLFELLIKGKLVFGNFFNFVMELT